MKIGMIGLGRMGCAMTHRLLESGHHCAVYDRDTSQYPELEDAGAVAAASLEELVAGLEPPRVVWIMVPADHVDGVIDSLTPILEAGDICIDGGNSQYGKDMLRSRTLGESGIHYMDVGTSGGIWGRQRGYCLMVGGEKKVFDYLEPLFESLSPGQGAASDTPGATKDRGTSEKGYLYCGRSGSGHFVKMVHNGIEYGMMAAMAEGFQLLKSARDIEGGGQGGKNDVPEFPDLEADAAHIAELWRRGSVVESWLLDLAARSLWSDPGLDDFTGHVPDSGEGRWIVETASKLGVPAFVLSAALFQRFDSRGQGLYGNKLLSALRKEFGGHSESG
jgi:6-phosphogluconate dehydrogenase